MLTSSQAHRKEICCLGTPLSSCVVSDRDSGNRESCLLNVLTEIVSVHETLTVLYEDLATSGCGAKFCS